jgi:hypothetical protein
VLLIAYDSITKAHGGIDLKDNEIDAFTDFVVTLPRRMIEDGGSRTWPDDRPCRPGFFGNVRNPPDPAICRRAHERPLRRTVPLA